MLLPDISFGIIGPFRVQRSGRGKALPGSFNLLFPDQALIITVFDGIGNYEMLLKVIFINPSVFVKDFVKDELTGSIR